MAQDLDLHRIVSTAIIYNERREFLIIKRAPDKKVYPGKWTVPGGGLTLSDYVDQPKTTTDGWYDIMKQSLQREIQEEVGLSVDRIAYLIDMVFIRPDQIPVLVLSYDCRYLGGQVKLDADSVDFSWVTLAQSRDYDLIPGIREEFVMVDRILQGEPRNQVTFKAA